MKWAVFAIALAGLAPLIQVLRRNQLKQPWIWLVLGAFPFLLTAWTNLNLSVISWPIWPGHVKGLQITALDLYAFAIYVALPRHKTKMPFRNVMFFYFFAVLVSSFSASVPFAVFFYAWQLVRMYLVYSVVMRASVEEHVVEWLMKGMALGLCYEACISIWERLHGAIQAGGSMGHQNFLGLLSHLVIFPFFALLLAGQRGWLTAITPFAGAIVWVLTASRATLGLGGMGIVALFAMSALRGWTTRKGAMLAVAGIAAAIFVPLALSSLDTRFDATPLAPDDVYDERLILNDVAAAMLADRPMGVGANNFTVVANTHGYYDRFPLSWMSRRAIVHNLYWLTAAETGYLGIIALMALLLQPLVVAAHCSWQNRKNPKGDLLLGISMAFFVVYLHSWYEWIFVELETEYIFAMLLGVVGGLAVQLGYWGRASIPRGRFSSSNSRKAELGEPVFRAGSEPLSRDGLR